MKRERLFLLVLWLALGLLIAGLAVWHPTQATSPDSVHYLRIASDWRTYDGTFPPGYPLLIWVASTVTTLPGLWASRLVNWLALGYLAWAWARRVGPMRATWLLAIWLLPGNLRIATYTWSETVFVVLLLEAVWYRCYRPGSAGLAGLLIALVWVRYVGVFIALPFRRTARINPGAGDNQLSPEGNSCFVIKGTTHSWPPYLFGGISFALLILLNLYLVNHPFGGPRLLPTEPCPELVTMLGRAILNEFCLYDFLPGVNQPWFFPALMGQVISGAIGVWWIRRMGHWRLLGAVRNPLLHKLFGVGLLYFLTLFGLRILSPFDPPNERLMAPGSICWLMAFVLSVQSQHSMMSKSPERAEIRTNPS